MEFPTSSKISLVLRSFCVWSGGDFDEIAAREVFVVGQGDRGREREGAVDLTGHEVRRGGLVLVVEPHLDEIAIAESGPTDRVSVLQEAGF